MSVMAAALMDRAAPAGRSSIVIEISRTGAVSAFAASPATAAENDKTTHKTVASVFIGVITSNGFSSGKLRQSISSLSLWARRIEPNELYLRLPLRRSADYT